MGIAGGVKLAAVLSTIHFLTVSCGSRSQPSGPEKSQAGVIETQFIQAATTHKIPVRYLLAVAYLESRINPMPSTAIYQNQGNAKGISIGETAFGLSYKKLDLPDNESSQRIDSQLDAYAKALKARLEDKQIQLSANPSTAEEKFNWLWQIASLHRGGITSRRNVQITFLKELLQTLNYGFSWQHQNSQEIIQLAPEYPPLKEDSFPDHIKSSMTIFTGPAEVYLAKFYELTYQRPNNWRNKPQKILVTHCPFSISACLEIQNSTEEQDSIRLGAHYLIPKEPSIIDFPVQLARHNQVVFLSNNAGNPESIQDSIVIMLTGNSGRYVDSKRDHADPTWFTKWQLKMMGDLIRNICPMLKTTDNNSLSEAEIVQCMNPNKNLGVKFRHQGASQQFHWGDIADYDENIFWPYIGNSESLRADITVQLPGEKNIFSANFNIPFQLSFIGGTATIIMEQAKICEGQRLIWSTIQNQRVNNVTSTTMYNTFWDQGPNKNGEHFLRILAFDNKNNLMAWTTQNIILTDYFTENTPQASDKECQRNGS
tara:strand:- start:577 stop:2199 length:1623 start_codon:yes stop_codon:yes gene_type:complete